MSISAIILAGGESKRFGAKKHLFAFAGQALVQTVADRVAELTGDLIVVTSPKEKRRLAVRGARVIADVIPGRGPLSGLHAGLLASDSEWVLLVACDMPFLSVSLMRHLSQSRVEADAIVPEIAGDIEPLHAVYARSCLPVVEELLAADNASMRDLLDRVDVRLVPEEEVRRFDPGGRSWFNLNTPEDADRARELLNSEDTP